MPVVLFIAFVVVPLIELAVIIEVGGLIGVVPTILVLVVDSLLGAWLVRREGRRAWRSLTQSFGTMSGSPIDELTQGGLIIFGGALLLTPGFVTDVLGLACVLPLTRPAMSSFVRRVGAMLAARRGGAGRTAMFGVFTSAGGSRSRSRDHSAGAATAESPGPRRTLRGSVTSDGQGASSDEQSAGFDGQPASESVPDVEVLDVQRLDD